MCKSLIFCICITIMVLSIFSGTVSASTPQLSRSDSNHTRSVNGKITSHSKMTSRNQSHLRGKGIGQFTALGLMAGLSWGNWIARMALARDCGIEGCAVLILGKRRYANESDLALAIYARGVPVQIAIGWGSNLSTWILAPLAGRRRGRYDAHFGTFRVLEPLRSRRFIATGTAMLAVGAYLNILLRYKYRGVGLSFPSQTDAHVRYLYLSLLQLSTASIAAGAGNLMYGLEYRRESHLLHNLRFRLGVDGIFACGIF